MKERKTQILAAFALAFMLGAVVPGSVFALEGDEDATVQEEDGIVAQSEETKETEAEVLPLVDSVVELTERISERETFANYMKSQSYVYETEVLAEFAGPLSSYVQNRQTSASDGEFWSHLNNAEKTKIENMSVWDAMNQLKTDEASAWATEVEAMKGWVDLVLSSIQGTMKSLRVQMSIVIDGESAETANATGHQKYDEFNTPVTLLAEAQKLPNYNKFKALYDASKFVISEIDLHKLSCATDGGTSSTMTTLQYCKEKRVELIKAFDGDYDDESDIVRLVLNYSAYVTAARAIDDTVASGLFQIVEAGSGTPNIPNSGILGLFDMEALDLGAITLIVSVVVASLAGAGLIAKLYLKHKF